MFDGMYEDWLIEGNRIETDAWHGISVLGGINVHVIGNYVSNQTSGLPGPPWTWVTVAAHKDGRPGKGNLIEGNQATAFRQGSKRMNIDPRVTVMRDNKALAPVR